MDKNKELNEAIEEIFEKIEESEEFKRRAKHLINNAMLDSYYDDDVLSVINLMQKED
ncbi:hypothetical protein [Exiguobacterium sp. SH0S7]|uniref:hypothetical protein n=1 Tax=Exiguobacterium sp. SH0S7 TaxID=2510951 RepID=UPI001315607D|nr:hypothetical protein [Exiguobacterium sp. SH0S7]